MKITRLKGAPRYFNAKTLPLDEKTELATFTIESAEVRTVSGEERVVLLFVDEERELKTTPHQVAALARAFGDDTDGWKGHTVELSRAEGKGINLRAVKPAQPAEE